MVVPSNSLFSWDSYTAYTVEFPPLFIFLSFHHHPLLSQRAAMVKPSQGTIAPPLTYQNFVFETVSFGSKLYYPLFLAFDKNSLKGDAASKRMSIGNLKPFEKMLVRTLMYFTYCFDGHVYSVLLEPTLFENQSQKLNPSLRSALSVGVLLVFLLDVEALGERSTEEQEEDILNSFVDEVFNERNDSDGSEGVNLVYVDGLVNAVKRLICHRLGMIGLTQLLLYGRDPQNYTKALFEHVDWNKGQVKATVKTKLLRQLGAPLLYTNFFSSVGNGGLFSSSDLSFDAHSFGRYVEQYFCYDADELGNVYVDSLRMDETQHMTENDTNACIWIALRRFKAKCLRSHPAIRRFMAISDTSMQTGPARLIESLVKTDERGLGCFPVHHDVLCFHHFLSDAFGFKNGFCMENTFLYEYPFLSDNQINRGFEVVYNTAPPHREAIAFSPQLVASLIVGLQSAAYTEEHRKEDDMFRLTFPHLANIADVISVLCNKDPFSSREHRTYALSIVNSLLFENGKRHADPVVREIYLSVETKMKQNGGNAALAFGLNWAAKKESRFPRFLSPFSDSAYCPVKTTSAAVTHFLFSEDFKITRLVQATVTANYIIANTAPRWRRGRFIIINHTRPGEGKTFTNEVMKELFAGDFPSVVESLMSITPTCLKYDREINILKTRIIDDAGFSTEVLKNARDENCSLAGTFKTILDNSYMNSLVTEKNEKTNSLYKQQHLAIHNTGFVWNTNSMSIFTNAVKDRALVLRSTVGSDPKALTSTVSDLSLTTICAEKGMRDIAAKLLCRQNVFQTLAYLFAPQYFFPLPEHDAVFRSARNRLLKRYPVIYEGGSGERNTSIGRESAVVRDLAFSNAAALACHAVYDLWIPPWTPIRKPRRNETTKAYVEDLNERRVRAVSMLSPTELLLECLMSYHLFYPGCMVEAMPTVLSQNVMFAMEFVKQVMAYALCSEERLLDFGHEDSVVIVDVSASNMSSPFDDPLTFRNTLEKLSNIRLPSKGAKKRIPLVQGVKPRGGGRTSGLEEPVVPSEQAAHEGRGHVVKMSLDVFYSLTCSFFKQEVSLLRDWICEAFVAGGVFSSDDVTALQLLPDTLKPFDLNVLRCLSKHSKMQLDLVEDEATCELTVTSQSLGIRLHAAQKRLVDAIFLQDLKVGENGWVSFPEADLIIGDVPFGNSELEHYTLEDGRCHEHLLPWELFGSKEFLTVLWPNLMHRPGTHLRRGRVECLNLTEREKHQVRGYLEDLPTTSANPPAEGGYLHTSSLYYLYHRPHFNIFDDMFASEVYSKSHSVACGSLSTVTGSVVSVSGVTQRSDDDGATEGLTEDWEYKVAGKILLHYKGKKDCPETEVEAMAIRLKSHHFSYLHLDDSTSEFVYTDCQTWRDCSLLSEPADSVAYFGQLWSRAKDIDPALVQPMTAWQRSAQIANTFYGANVAVRRRETEFTSGDERAGPTQMFETVVRKRTNATTFNNITPPSKMVCLDALQNIVDSLSTLDPTPDLNVHH